MGALSAKERMRKARAKDKQAGYVYYTFKVNGEILDIAKSYCMEKNIPLKNLLLELIK